MTAIVLGFLLHIASLGFEVNPTQLDKDILWMRWGGYCWWVDLSKRKDGPKLPNWQSAYDFISMTYNYHVVKGNVKPSEGANPALCVAALGVDTSLMVAAPVTPPVVIPAPVVTSITAPTGTLTDAAGGVWTFGAATSNGGNALVLNGAATGGFGKTLQLINGKVYTFTVDGKWFVWAGSWQSTTAPQ